MQSGTKPNLVANILATKFGFVPDWYDYIRGHVCPKQVSMAGKSNYTLQILWDVIACLCPLYLCLAHSASFIKTNIKKWLFGKTAMRHVIFVLGNLLHSIILVIFDTI